MTQPNETQRPQISVCKACSAASSGWLSCPHCGTEDWEDVGAYVLTDTRAPVDSQGAEETMQVCRDGECCAQCCLDPKHSHYRQLAVGLAAIVDVATSDDPGTALAKVHKLQSDAATQMRTACVTAMRDRLHDPSLRFADDGMKAAVTDWTNMLITIVSSLTLDQVKQKEQAKCVEKTTTR